MSSKNYNKVKQFWSQGLWDIIRVTNAVKKNCITVEEFEEITGQVYDAALTEV